MLDKINITEMKSLNIHRISVALSHSLIATAAITATTQKQQKKNDNKYIQIISFPFTNGILYIQKKNIK